MKNKYNSLTRFFNTERPLIGMIHFPPLIGYPDYPGFEFISKKMLEEAKILENSGFDGVIIENNYDIPHNEKISTMTAAMFGSLATIISQNIKIPFGLSVLWNDYEAALSICAATKARFFRVPAFVDTVKTAYGIMPARAKEIMTLRKKLGLNKIGIFADIQVKHSETIDKTKPLEKSAKEAVSAGASAVIVTGKWTGDAPKVDDLETVRKAIGSFPILVGSGATVQNLPLLSKYTDGVIVGTALKEGDRDSKEINVKPFMANVFSKRAIGFAKKFRKVYTKDSV